MVLDYAKLSEKIEKMLRKEKGIILATSADDRVTARMMAPVSDGLCVMFSTAGGSQKVAQIKKNPNIALAVGNIKIEAAAELFGPPAGHPTFMDLYRKKFPLYAKLYQGSSSDMLILAKPVKISLYEFDGKPCEDVLDVSTGTAYRVDLTA